MPLRSILLPVCLLFLGGCSTDPTPVPPASKDHSPPSNPTAATPSVDRTRLNKQLLSEVETILATEDGEHETSQSIERVKDLLAQGADPNTKDDGGSIIITAANNGHIVALKLLLDRGADINAQDDRGRTALMAAANVKDYTMVQLLLARGAKPNLTDENGFTALTGGTLVGGPAPPGYNKTMSLLRRASAPGFQAASLREPALEIPQPRTILHRDDVRKLPVARTLTDMYDLEDAIRNNQDLGALAMMHQGKFQMVLNDSGIEVVERNLLHCRVKIKNTGKVGWVLCDWIKPIG